MPFRSFDLAEVAETLRDSERRYRALFERAPAPILVIDAESLAILGVNDAAVSRYGYAREEFTALTFGDLWPPAGRAELFHAQAALKAGRDLRSVFRHRSRANELFDVEVTTRSLPFGDERLRVVLAYDVSEHTRSADTATFLDRASSLFAGSLDFTTICRNLATISAARLGDWCAVHRVHDEGRIELAGFAHANPLDERLVASAVLAREPLRPPHPLLSALASGRATVLAAGEHSSIVMGGATDATDAASGATAEADGRLSVAAVMYLPIRARGRVLAVLECVASSIERTHEATRLALGEELASRAAPALDAALRYEEACARGTRPDATRPAVAGESAGEGIPLDGILEHLMDGVLGIDDQWRVVSANRAAERALRLSRADMLGCTFWDLFPEILGTPFETNYLRAAAAGEPVEFEDFLPARNAWYRVSVYPSAGGLGIIFRETTATHRAEAERRDANRILFDYADRATDLIHLLAPDGRIVFANRAWREVLGYTDVELKSQRLEDIVAPEFRAIAHEALGRRLAGDFGHVVELEVLARDGRHVRVQGTATCRFVEGEPIAVLGIFRDVTAQRESEAALAAARTATAVANRTKTEFLDRMSHELRTPLTGIIGFARLLERNREGTMSPTEADYASRIARQGRKLLTVIDDVLAYAEIEGRRLDLEVAPVDLRAIARDVAAEFSSRAAAASVALLVRGPAEVAPVQTDAARLRRVVRHLVDNAIKFSRVGAVSITVTADAVTGRPVSLEVADRGPGIPAGREREILEPFRQGTGDAARQFTGMGLGLSIAEALARLLGFTLTLHAAEGGGTRAVLTLGTAGVDGATDRDADQHPTHRGRVELATLLQGVVRASPLAVIAYDVRYDVRLWNEAATRIFGWTAADIIGSRVPFVREADDAAFRLLMRRAAALGGITEEPMTYRRKDGALIAANASIAPLRDVAGRLSGFMCIIADVTVQNRREEQLRQAQKMEVVGKLASGIAHDFNNLLTVIAASASFLLDEMDAGDPRRSDAEVIRAAGMRAADLTRQLMRFARQEAPERGVFDLRVIATEAVRMLERVIGSHISLASMPSVDACPVFADAGQVEQIVMNLVLNARDAMPHGGALVVGTEHRVVPATAEGSDKACDVHGREITPGHYASITVADSGHGMTRDTIRRIFEPFYTTKAAGSGTGLGLATVEAVVTDAGGYVQVESVPGEGTTFRILLPLAALGPSTIAPATA